MIDGVDVQEAWHPWQLHGVWSRKRQGRKREKKEKKNERGTFLPSIRPLLPSAKYLKVPTTQLVFYLCCIRTRRVMLRQGKRNPLVLPWPFSLSPILSYLGFASVSFSWYCPILSVSSGTALDWITYASSPCLLSPSELASKKSSSYCSSSFPPSPRH